ncbi:hypothetical protein H6G06_08480 [Anabaena sphaerica FACHB-251]|uniref:Uncharacterized protein n=1 Tax=Anabaena sphaerica FACHB-251 TaxID=2692883 RepID=A0A926WG37_9NOST|nr:hypothetical protein [Anabaena sphaerica]MBD2293522.1 hypothetical protein [Anabaena sphaerica FACHB-251]
MAITIAKTLLSNQSILENIALVEEIDEQAAEIISGGQSVNLLNTGISSFEDDENDITPVDDEDLPDPIITHPESVSDSNPLLPAPNQPLPINQGNFVFG